MGRSVGRSVIIFSNFGKLHFHAPIVALKRKFKRPEYFWKLKDENNSNFFFLAHNYSDGRHIRIILNFKKWSISSDETVRLSVKLFSSIVSVQYVCMYVCVYVCSYVCISNFFHDIPLRNKEINAMKPLKKTIFLALKPQILWGQDSLYFDLF